MVHDVVELDGRVVGGRRRRGSRRPAARRTGRASGTAGSRGTARRRATQAGLLDVAHGPVGERQQVAARPGRARLLPQRVRSAPGTASAGAVGVGRRSARGAECAARCFLARCARGPALQLVGVDRRGSGRGAAAGRTPRRRRRTPRVAAGSSSASRRHRSARRHRRRCAARRSAACATRSSCSRRSRPRPSSSRAPAHSRRARSHHAAGASCSDRIAVRRAGAESRRGARPRSSRRCRSGANGRSSRLSTPKTASPVMQARIAPGRSGATSTPSAGSAGSLRPAGDRALCAGQRLGRQCRSRASKPVRVDARLGAPRLGQIGQPIVVRVHADERRVDRPPAVVGVEERIQPGVESGRLRHAGIRRRPVSGSGRSTQRRSWNDSSTALITSCTQAPSSKLPWLRRRRRPGSRR